MSLVNYYFRDFPAEFKEINPDDFPNQIIENNGEKIIIEPDVNGYITTGLESNININQKNTVIVNAAVGQGKTTAIINVLKRLYEDEQDFLIFVASPFVSLVEQYFNEITDRGIAETDIFRYENIGSGLPFLDKKVHIITVNGLLGNPGSDSLINSASKRKYLNKLSRECQRVGRKVVIIMDEIHDAIHNFKEEYIFNLWKWQPVLHKNIILSATYNEASKVVIEYLAELTDDRIQIIESKRTRIPNNLSDLHLHYNPALYYKYNNLEITDVVRELIDRSKDVDILCFSKKLADDIIDNRDDGIGEVLYTKYNVINRCTSNTYLRNSDDDLLTNRFDNTKCNVGTNFKTGVSIKKRDHAFLIILPPKGSKNGFQTANGIFSNGINSIIQALARQRKRGGEIHIILPPPEKFNYSTLPFDGDKKEKFIEFYDEVKDFIEVRKPVNYIPYSRHSFLVNDFYENKLRENVRNQITLVNQQDRSNRPRLEFPAFKSFMLENGENYLANNIKFLGKDLSSFVTYCAATNQFVNCNLTAYTAKASLIFPEGSIQNTLEYLFEENYINEGNFIVYSETTDFYRYLEFKNHLFNYYKLYHLTQTGSQVLIIENKDRAFEVELLGFMHRQLHPGFNERFLVDGDLRDNIYSRSDYFMSCIVVAMNFDLEQPNLTSEVISRVNCFRNLKYFRDRLIASFREANNTNRGNFHYILKKPSSTFIQSIDLPRFNQMIDHLVNSDYFISRDIFEFKQRFKPAYSQAQKINSFYTKLIEDFLVVEDSRLSTGSRRHIGIVVETKPLFEINLAIDFLSSADTNFSDEFWENNSYEVIDGKLVKINMS
ncbi:DEAD/DEAH box helicase [Leeuwenhoekiella sp. W20_SRS_FM14]|uniref:DEAD/DEAH box helicase n=1 Tax=Leeuwenhoekiella sp. W20_SRS_FM14 TaxID=3240270 RepID=UPI003F9C0969